MTVGSCTRTSTRSARCSREPTADTFSFAPPPAHDRSTPLQIHPERVAPLQGHVVVSDGWTRVGGAPGRRAAGPPCPPSPVLPPVGAPLDRSRSQLLACAAGRGRRGWTAGGRLGHPARRASQGRTGRSVCSRAPLSHVFPLLVLVLHPPLAVSALVVVLAAGLHRRPPILRVPHPPPSAALPYI